MLYAVRRTSLPSTRMRLVDSVTFSDPTARAAGELRVSPSTRPQRISPYFFHSVHTLPPYLIGMWKHGIAENNACQKTGNHFCFDHFCRACTHQRYYGIHRSFLFASGSSSPCFTSILVSLFSPLLFLLQFLQRFRRFAIKGDQNILLRCALQHGFHLAALLLLLFCHSAVLSRR